MGKRLPIKLGKEPLLEAVCEIRFQAKVGLHTVAPGLVFSTLDEVGQVQSLPAASLPDAIRANHPDLAGAPLVRIDWKGYTLLVGEKSFAIACNPPYRGWSQFKEDIINIFSLILESRFVESVDRYSIKYVNLLEEPDVSKQYGLLDWNIKVGSLPVANGPAQVRFEMQDEDAVTVVSIATAAVAQLNSISKFGCVIDVDTICNVNALAMEDFKASIEHRLEEIRGKNKAVFFDCLCDSTIQSLEPSYA